MAGEDVPKPALDAARSLFSYRSDSPPVADPSGGDYSGPLVDGHRPTSLFDVVRLAVKFGHVEPELVAACREVVAAAEKGAPPRFRRSPVPVRDDLELVRREPVVAVLSSRNPFAREETIALDALAEEAAVVPPMRTVHPRLIRSATLVWRFEVTFLNAGHRQPPCTQENPADYLAAVPTVQAGDFREREERVDVAT